jgi:multicomponent Na+:H+ antiporter subunit C
VPDRPDRIVAPFAAGGAADILARILAINVCSGGVFLILVAAGYRGPGVAADPVPHALVLTGIVVAISATALALALVRRIVNRAIDDGCTSEDAFKRLHPRMSAAVDELRDKVRSRLPKIPYDTPQMVEGEDATVKVINTAKSKVA